MNRFAIVGFGCAGYHALEAIRQNDSTALIDIYSETSEPPYNPMLTTYYVAGKLPYEGMFPFGTIEEISARYAANFYSDTHVVHVNAEQHTVETADGSCHRYDKVLIATGATAFVPPSLGGVAGAFCMRTLQDAKSLRNALQQRKYRHAVVVGASMVGIKIAELLHDRGCKVVLVDMAPHVFSLAAYPEVSEMVEARLTELGIALHFGKGIASLVRKENGLFVLGLADGSEIETELVVLNIGTRAATGVLDPKQVKIDRGIVVNDRMETSAPGIYAAGDCCQAMNLQSGQTQIIGLWANAGVQGRVAGCNMAGGRAENDGNIPHNITHFLNMDFIGLGDNRLTGDIYRYQDREKRFYLQAVVQDGRPVSFNILDNYGVSGILKSHLIKLLRAEQSAFTPEQRGQLRRYGLDNACIGYLEGIYD